MWSRGERKGTLACALMLLIFGPRTAAAGGNKDVSFDQVRLGDGEAAIALRAALARAVSRLAAPACQRILSEFHDVEGRPLQAVLTEAGKSSSQYIAGLFFYEGSGMPQCSRPGILAFTTPGSRVVLVCSTLFRSVEREDASQVDVVLIHETLHTLGLGENPPTSQYISARVFTRCVANGGR